jgi:hypothetical protein
MTDVRGTAFWFRNKDGLYLITAYHVFEHHAGTRWTAHMHAVEGEGVDDEAYSFFL